MGGPSYWCHGGSGAIAAVVELSAVVALNSVNIFFGETRMSEDGDTDKIVIPEGENTGWSPECT